MTKIKTNEQFVCQANKLHRNRYQYPEEYQRDYIKIAIVCDIHGEFHQTPSSHLQGGGCPQCAKNTSIRKRSKTHEQFLLEAFSIHGDRYNYLEEYHNSHTKIKIECKVHGIFIQAPEKHLSGNGCPLCGGTVKKTKEKFIAEANKIHKNKYTYPGTYLASRKYIDINCPIHGIFKQIPDAHLKGVGCPECGHLSSSIKRSKESCDSFIERCVGIHGNKYNYIKSIYVNTHKKIIIICNVCNYEFCMTPSKHLGGQGCPKCADAYTAKLRKKKISVFIEQAVLVHGNKYDYSYLTDDIYKNSATKIPIFCKRCAKIFYQAPGNHLHGNGCQKCAKRNFVSKVETEWLDYLNVPAECRQIFIKLNNKRNCVDAYIPETNTIYEFYGDYWHGNPKTKDLLTINHSNKKTLGQLYEETIKRENLIKSAGYNLISIWESDWNEFKLINNVSSK